MPGFRKMPTAGGTVVIEKSRASLNRPLPDRTQPSVLIATALGHSYVVQSPGLACPTAGVAIAAVKLNAVTVSANGAILIA
jgi:hypothetical protein